MKDSTEFQKSIETVVQRAFPSANVQRVVTKAGSSNGDNRLGVMFALEVQMEINQEGQPMEQRKHLILKTSSLNEARKHLSEKWQVFDKEAAIYNEFIPELIKFQEGRTNENAINAAFVQCYDTLCSHEIKNRKCDGTVNCVHCQPPLPWDYILMQDIRHDGGYKMGDRFEGLNFDHCELVMSELARYHALSYAYIKTFTTSTELFEKFPFLKESMMSIENGPIMSNIYCVGRPACLKILAGRFPIDSFEYQKLKTFIEGAFNIIAHFVAGSNDLSSEEMLSTPVDLTDVNILGRERKERNQWLVVAHGDAWATNFMFKYCGEKPVGVKLIDLPNAREICLATDIAYFLYLSTTPKLRKKHLNELLRVYFNTFKDVCESLKVEPWKDFTLENLKSKYKKAMLYGASIAFAGLPIILLPEELSPDLEANSADTICTMAKSTLVKNENLENRILETAYECFEHGIFN